MAAKMGIKMNASEQVAKSVKINVLDGLRKEIPQAFEDGKINLDRLKEILSGSAVEKEDDRFYFNWAGKSSVFRLIQAPAYGTLKPVKEKSVDFENTENIVVQGENLETLKLMLKPYFGKVKMIYIDPPYNTGKDFIYTDDFKQPLKDYLEKTGQVDAQGAKLTTNTDKNGRFHSDWLNFMYPRLFLAKSLLKEDGVIFVSIDDNEVHHLRMIMDEIFGEEKFVAEFIWHSRQNVDSRSLTGSSIDHEYVLCYTKCLDVRIRGKEIDKEKYSNPDNDPRGPWMSSPMDGIATKDKRPNLHYTIVNPITKNEYNPSPESGWRFQKSTVESLIQENRIIWPKNPNSKPRFKRYLNELKNEFTGFSSILEADFTAQGTKELREIFGKETLKFPKPVSLISVLIDQAVKNDDILLDFFAGSGTTGQAVWELNKEDGGKRKFILVQIPEKTPEDSEARKAGYETIADICIERLKRVSEKLRKEEKQKIDKDEKNAQDFGFKVFKLDGSNFNQKDEFQIEEGISGEELRKKYLEWLGLWVNEPLVGKWNPIDVVYETALKEGLDLNSKIEAQKIGNNHFFRVADERQHLEFYISLDDKISDETVEEIRTSKYRGCRFVFLDKALTDSGKINLKSFVELKVI
jgi:adenine-specific DNA-methyltransferase